MLPFRPSTAEGSRRKSPSGLSAVAFSPALAVLVDSVDLEHVLRQVDANSRKPHGGRPSVRVVVNVTTWHVDAAIGGGVHPVAYIAGPHASGLCAMGGAHAHMAATRTPGHLVTSRKNAANSEMR